MIAKFGQSESQRPDSCWFWPAKSIDFELIWVMVSEFGWQFRDLCDDFGGLERFVSDSVWKRTSIWKWFTLRSQPSGGTLYISFSYFLIVKYLKQDAIITQQIALRSDLPLAPAIDSPILEWRGSKQHLLEAHCK